MEAAAVEAAVEVAFKGTLAAVLAAVEVAFKGTLDVGGGQVGEGAEYVGGGEGVGDGGGSLSGKESKSGGGSFSSLADALLDT